MVLGARLPLLALDGAADMIIDPLLLLFGLKFEDELDGNEETYPDSEPLLKEATSAWSSHLRMWPNLLSV
jgi:hypothetical protein